MNAPPDGPARRVPVWDLPTRLFHWLLVLMMPILWWTAEAEMLPAHRAAGYVVLGLILFRLLWGFVGSSTARFAGFVRGPRAILDYARGRLPVALGHNPLGALSVIGLLGLTALEVGLGLIATDEDGLEAGPLSHLVSYELARDATDFHEDLFNLLLALIALHVAAILFYLLFKRDNLVGPMLTGHREAPETAAPMRPAPAWRFVLAAALAAAATLWISGVLAG